MYPLRLEHQSTRRLTLKKLLRHIDGLNDLHGPRSNALL